MLDGVYKNYLSMLALGQLIKPADVPNVELCIGDAEQLQSIPVLLFKTAPVSQGIADREDYTKIPYEKVGSVGDYEPLSNKDFCYEFDLGEPIGRW